MKSFSRINIIDIPSRAVQILFLTFVLLSTSCSKQASPVAWKIVCYQFDQRQCQTDEWAELIPLNLSSSQKKEKMMMYLESKGLEIVRVELKEKYHEFTCEACNICPYAHRFFVEMNDKNILNLKRLKLLNLSKCACTEF